MGAIFLKVANELKEHEEIPLKVPKVLEDGFN
jgi:hypothetical protein